MQALLDITSSTYVLRIPLLLPSTFNYISCLSVDVRLKIYVVCFFLLFTDQAAKCDEVVPDKEHRHCQRSDPRASYHSKGRGPALDQGR